MGVKDLLLSNHKEVLKQENVRVWLVWLLVYTARNTTNIGFVFDSSNLFYSIVSDNLETLDIDFEVTWMHVSDLGFDEHACFWNNLIMDWS